MNSQLETEAAARQPETNQERTAESEKQGACLSADDGTGRVIEWLGLHADPFAPDGLPDFFFVGGQRRYLAQQAVHQLYFGASLLLLLGDDGSGKSGLLHWVRRELRGIADTCVVAATVMTDGGELRHAVATTLGLGTDVAAANETLSRALTNLRPADAEPEPVLLLIDDAHLLAPAVLADCSLLSSLAGGRLRILMAGEPPLLASWQRLPDSPLSSGGRVAQLNLEPLDEQESVDYLRTRLQAAGMRTPLPLTAEAERQLCRRSGGNLAAIQAVGAELLLAALTQAGQPAIAERRLSSRILYLALGGLAAIVAGGGAMMSDAGSTTSAVSDAPAAARSTGDATDGRTRVPLVLDWERAPAAQRQQYSDAVSSNAGAQAQEKPAAQGSAAPDLSGARNSKALPGRDTAAPSHRAPSAVEAPLTAPALPATRDPRSSSPTPVVSGLAEGDASSGATESPPPAVAASAHTPDERALLALPDGQFMLQLMGARSLAKLQASLRASGIDQRVYYFESRLGGKPWFVAVTGPFARDAAAAAIAELPASLRRAKPWPRALASIHSDIAGR